MQKGNVAPMMRLGREPLGWWSQTERPTFTTAIREPSLAIGGYRDDAGREGVNGVRFY